jgi:DNA modification methylase
MARQLDILHGNCRQVLPTLPPESVQCCVTSPPYWGLRDYGVDGQLGLEPTPDEYVANMVAVFSEVARVLRDDGTLWLNLGDSYASGSKGSGGPNEKQDSNAGSYYDIRKFNHGLKPKDLCGIPWRVAFALQADGWYLRSDIIWHKPNPMPESVTDRPTKAHEYLFLLSKQERYFYDAEAIREDKSRHGGGQLGSPDFRNKRTVWTIPSQPYSEAHFATFPEDLVKPCILAGSRLGDTILDPFSGSGTVGKVATEFGRRAVLIELNPSYIKLADTRTNVTPGFL